MESSAGIKTLTKSFCILDLKLLLIPAERAPPATWPRG